MTTPTSPANLKLINAMYKKQQNLMVNLAGRWADESRYENIDEYQKVIERAIGPQFTIAKMSKRPFGFQFTIGTDALYSLTVDSRGTYEWKRVLPVRAHA